MNIVKETQKCPPEGSQQSTAKTEMHVGFDIQQKRTFKQENACNEMPVFLFFSAAVLGKICCAYLSHSLKSLSTSLKGE